MSTETKWYETHDELIAFARVLDDLDVFDCPDDAIDFFETPWKWDDEYERWVALGRPDDLDDIATLQGEAVA